MSSVSEGSHLVWALHISKFTLSQLVADYLLPSKYSIVFPARCELGQIPVWSYQTFVLIKDARNTSKVHLQSMGEALAQVVIRQWRKQCFLSYYPFRHGEGSRTLNSEYNTNIWLHLLAPHQRRWLVPEGRQRYLRHSGESPTFAQWVFTKRTDILRISLQSASQTGLL